MSGDVRGELAEALAGHEPFYRDGYLGGEPGSFVCECGNWIHDDEHGDAGVDHRRHLADALLPVVERIAREAAAEALRDAADAIERLEPVMADWLRARADAAALRGPQ